MKSPDYFHVYIELGFDFEFCLVANMHSEVDINMHSLDLGFVALHIVQYAFDIIELACITD